MEKLKDRVDFEKQQYYIQANLVYISSFFAHLVIFIPVMLLVGNTLISILTGFSLFSAFLAIYINRKYNYRLASFIFLTMTTIQTVAQVVVFGMGYGFMFYFFNICVLIVYTKWKGLTRFLWVFAEVLIAVGLIVYHQFYHPLHILSPSFGLFFLVINLVLNVTGVAHSASFYIGIVQRARKNLEYLATRDYLTGLPNRAALRDFIDDFVCHNANRSHNLGVMMLDIDYFKQINDSFGHGMGDMVLKQTALLLLQHAKNSDFVCRYGGEEFLMILDISAVEKLAQLAEKIRKEFQETSFAYQNQTCKATISIGAVYKYCEGNHDFIEEIEKADGLLYQAKQNGRNQVVMKHDAL